MAKPEAVIKIKGENKNTWEKRFKEVIILNHVANVVGSSYGLRAYVYDYESTRFEVEEIFNAVTQRGGKVFNVFLNERKCECGAFQAYRYPCSHAIAACAHVRIDPLTFVDAAYTNEYIKAAYSGQWFPLGSEENIQPTNGPRIVPDETMIRTKGRPKSTRIRNEMDWTESQRRQRCGHCRREGHNRTNCPVLAEDVFNNA
ncbi:uncharacterized protein LOC109806256 [Cajanus cajan]|uniref:uncharacterized protein LOC109806256 n=1 Tax=Cajanus cajan TaxID=3821 RepID=UPI00098DC43F|nr:uncharacterized protein LOC109806256 [Cajanus cajan]